MIKLLQVGSIAIFSIPELILSFGYILCACSSCEFPLGCLVSSHL